MLSIKGQRMYLSTIEGEDGLDRLGAYASVGDGAEAICSAPGMSVIKAGEDVLAIVLNEAWADNLVYDQVRHWKQREAQLAQVDALCDEINALKLEISQLKVQAEVHAMIMAGS